MATLCLGSDSQHYGRRQRSERLEMEADDSPTR
jgi:hypothetical protein